MSEIRVTTISDTAGTGPVTLTKQSAAKFFISLNGTGTPAARDSLNFSSVTDNSTGDYTLNFTNNMANTDYAATSAGGQHTGASNNNVCVFYKNVVANSIMIQAIQTATDALIDQTFICSSIQGDLA